VDTRPGSWSITVVLRLFGFTDGRLLPVCCPLVLRMPGAGSPARDELGTWPAVQSAGG
jgi:hypothetical protein